jgi:hypothetical protein
MIGAGLGTGELLSAKPIQTDKDEARNRGALFRLHIETTPATTLYNLTRPRACAG